MSDTLSHRLQLADRERDIRSREAVARERAVIARELHDIVAHSVSLMVVQAGTARPLAERVDAELAGVLVTIERSGREALSELRRLLGLLRAADDADLGPVPDLGCLHELIDSVRSAGLDVRADIDIGGRIAPGVALCAYRAVQEGLTNALRYAEGSSVDVTVAVIGRTLQVRVQDYGGESSAEALGGGAGLIGLRERVLLCGGQMVACPSAGGYLPDVTLPTVDQALPMLKGGNRDPGSARRRPAACPGGLRAAAARRDDIEVVGGAADGAAAVALARDRLPDVVLMDVRMPGMDGIDATAGMVRDRPQVRVLVLTTFDLDEAVHRALRAGASGFLLKDTPYDQLVRAIRVVARLRRLSDREQEVLGHGAEGLSNAEIGARLFLSEATVKTHVGRVPAKLGCRDRVQAVAFAYRTGFSGRT